MRLLIWYWGRRGGGGQQALALARALAHRQDVAVALSLSAQSDLIDDLRATGLPIDAVPTYRSAAGFAAGFPGGCGARRRISVRMPSSR